MVKEKDTRMAPTGNIFINGQWVALASDEFIEVVKPTTMEVITRGPAGNAEDVDHAVHAAIAAFNRRLQVPVAEPITFTNIAENVERFEFETREGALLIVGEPAKGVGGITPWNFLRLEIKAPTL
jgi:acyl-CoA reductase-like NAD-dependent aldehyde dehydrogenase